MVNAGPSSTGTGGLPQRRDRLFGLLRGMQRVIVAYSGGVDSAVLAWAAHQALGEAAVAAVAVSPSLPARELREAEDLAKVIGIRLEQITTREFEDERYLRNDGDRCYWCRHALVEALEPLARSRNAALVYGAIPDDLGDHRPGMQAAREGGVRAPLIEAGLGKDDVRALAREAGLAVWDKPASACLSSRIPVGRRVTVDALTRVDRAEEALSRLGFRVVRVRDHGEIARIELDPGDIPRLVDDAMRREVVESVRAAGYQRVTLDLAGYRPSGLAPLPSAADPAESPDAP